MVGVVLGVHGAHEGAPIGQIAHYCAHSELLKLLYTIGRGEIEGKTAKKVEV